MRPPLVLLALLATTACTADGGRVTAPRETVTATATVTATPDDPGVDPETDGKIRAADWKIGIRVREKQCFGSAGCNVTFQIVPRYTGSHDLGGSWDITYRVVGGEDPIINTFTVDDGEASYDEEEYASTARESDKLAAKVTGVYER